MAQGDSSTSTTQQTPNQSIPQNVESPQALKTWWNGFKKRTKKEQIPRKIISHTPCLSSVLMTVLSAPAPGIFGVPLQESIKYANVAISLANERGESFIYGYVPIVVAKCGVFLKEKGKRPTSYMECNWC